MTVDNFFSHGIDFGFNGIEQPKECGARRGGINKPDFLQYLNDHIIGEGVLV
jgi:hypothetical protein